MSTEIKFALVGYGSPNIKTGSVAGRGSFMFKHALSAFDFVKPAAICDKNPDSLADARNKFPNVPVFTDYDEMLQKVAIDALYVATPATCHAVFCARALERNIHVLSEIPAVNSLEDVAQLWAAQQRSQSLYMTAANPNYWGFVQTAVDLKTKGLFGAPYYVEASYIHDIRGLFLSTPWRATYEPIRYSTHSLGPVLRLIDEDLEWVTCFDTGSHINRQPDQHDAMAALFRTRSGVVFRLLTSFINNYVGEGHAYRFFTTKGCFERTPAYPTHRNDAAERERTLFYSTDFYGERKWTELPVDDSRPELAGEAHAIGHGGADYAMLYDFFHAVLEGRPSPISLREGLRMTIPGLYAAESARRGGELMRIEYPWGQPAG